MPVSSSTVNNFFYLHGTDIGLVAASSTDSEIYSPITNAATIKIFGTFEESDITIGASGDASSFSNINSRHHKAIVYKVLSEVIGKKSGFYEDKYLKALKQARSQGQPLRKNRQIKLTDF